MRARHVSNQQRILPRMNEKFAILLSTFGPSSTFSLLSYEICAKHSVGTRPFGLPIDSHTLLVRLGQVKTIKIYLLLRVPECATFLFYSFSPSSVPAGTVEVNEREFDIIKNESNYINRHYKEENDLIRFQDWRL